MSAAVATGANGLREVRLYGHLRARFGRSHWLAVQSPAEALRALCALFKGFREALQAHKGPGYRVLLGEGERTQARDAETLGLGTSAPVIRIAPVIHGGKRGGVLQTILGVGLLFAAPYAAAMLFEAGFVMSAIAVANFAPMVAKYMILGGVIQMLSPQRSGKGNTVDSESSYLFNGGANVTSPGGAVPLVIGRFVCGSTTVSAGIATDEAALNSSGLPGNPYRPANEPEDIHDDYIVGSP